MSLTESIVEAAALEWFPLRPARRDYGGQVGELGYAVGHRPDFGPNERASRDGGRDSFCEVVLTGRLRKAIRGLNPAIPSRTLATLRDTLLPKLLSGEIQPAQDLCQEQ